MTHTHLSNSGLTRSAFKATPLKTSMIALATAAALSVPAIAQEEASDDRVLQTVTVVSKFQRSIIDSIAQKRNADAQIEAISLEDVGVLPADSIADAIATLPGVAGARTDEGSISNLSIRGTTDLTLGLLNGREQVTVASNRNVEYALYPQSIVQGVQVYKTSKAELPEGGLSGIVNIDTLKPLNFTDRRIVANGEIRKFELADDVLNADEWGGNGSLTYIDQFSDNFGMALAFSFAQETRGGDGDVSPFAWQPFRGGFGPPPDIDGDGDIGDEVIPEGFTIQQEGGSEDRISAFAALQYEAGTIDANFDFLYSEREQDLLTAGWNFIGLLNNGGTLVDPVFSPRGDVDEVIGGQITVPGSNATGFGSGGSSGFNQLGGVVDEVISTGLNVKHTGENWVLDADLSLSSAEREESFETVTTNLAPTGGFGGPTIVLDLDPLGEEPSLGVNVDLTDPTILVPRQYDRSLSTAEDEMVALRLGAERPLDIGGDNFRFDRIKFGARFSERTKDFARLENRQSTALIPDDPTLPLDGMGLIGIATPDNGPAYAVYDPTVLRSLFALETPEPGDSSNPVLVANTLLEGTGSVEETNTSVFAQLDFEAGDSGAITGNIGLRYVSTDLSAPGFQAPQRDSVPADAISPEHDYAEWLPSANVNVELTDTQVIRLGIAKVLNRAPLDDLVSSRTLFISGFGATGFSGNPELDPTLAWQASASWEWYPTDDSSLVFAAYYSDLDTFIGTEFQDLVVDVSGTPTTVNLETVANGEGGYIRGFEIAGNSTLGFISDSLDTFGVSANYAFTESNVTPVGGGESEGAALTGLSEDVANFQLWWADYGFEARVGFDYRSEYVEPNVFNNFVTVDDTLLANFQVNYDITPDYRISLFGSNITDEQRRKYTGNIADRTEFNVGYRPIYGVRFFARFD